MTRNTLLLIPVLCLSAAAGRAQDTTAVDGRRLNEVVVTANRTEVNRHNVPMIISVVGKEELRQSGESNILSALSQRVPGLFVTERNIAGFGVGSRGAGGMTLRGVGGDRMLILIDGHPQYMGVMGHALADAYAVSNIEKVEVVRGPASILYGSNAMNGAINMITRRHDADGWSADASLMYGSYNTQKHAFSAGQKKGRFDAFVAVSQDRTDGNRAHSAFSATNGYAKVGYRISNHFRAWADVNLASYGIEDPGADTELYVDCLAEILRGVASVTLENRYGSTDGAFKFFYNFGDHKINDGHKEGYPLSLFYFRSNDHNYGVNWYQIFRPFRGNMVTAGVDFKNFGGRAWNDYIAPATPDVVETDTSLYEAAGYLLVQQMLFDRLTLNAGARFEHNQQFGNEWIPQAGLSYRPFRHTVLKAAASKGFRSPNMQELFYKAAWAGHNPELKPERMTNYEISVGQDFCDRRVSVELTGFISEGSNLIEADRSHGYPPTNYNTGSFLNKGVEFTCYWQAFSNFTLQGNYAYLYMMDAPILYAPKHQAFLAASYRWQKWSFNANYKFVDDMYISTGSSELTDTYGLLDARISFRPTAWLDVFVKGNNLTGRDYQIVSGYPMPGTTVFGGINISL
ncbi:MAG: TonB-dependent receptor [Prevotellaceae bacterium]|jgi:iron complex outermembrane receptor protein|nr:TonB-dependent receptor [Prevotellaceae bacterium]